MADSDSDSKLAIAMADSDSKLAQGKARGGGNYILSILFPRVGNFVNGMLAPLGAKLMGATVTGACTQAGGAHVSLIGAAPAAPSIPLNFFLL